MTKASSYESVGPLLREWRGRRRLTQFELALDAGISARHLSFVETGRSKPGREMLLAVAEQLQIPFRERNQLLLAAGHAPAADRQPGRVARALPEALGLYLALVGATAVATGAGDFRVRSLFPRMPNAERSGS